MSTFKTNTYKEYLPSTLSLTLEEMDQIHVQMLQGIRSNPDATELYQDLLAQALKYFQYRVNWALWNREEQLENDSYRTGCHNALIMKFNILARFQSSLGYSAEWRDLLGDENQHSYTRKRIGYFACYLAFVNAINER